MSPRWSSYVAPKPPKRGSKMQNGHFPSKIALSLKKVCYKVSLCENCQWQSCRAFIGLSIRGKMIGGDVPFYVKIWRILTHSLAQHRFLIYLARSTSAITPNKKVLLTLIGSPLRASQCTSVRCLAVAKKLCNCSYSIFARSTSAITSLISMSDVYWLTSAKPLILSTIQY